MNFVHKNVFIFVALKMWISAVIFFTYFLSKSDLPQYNGVYYVLKTDYLTYTVEVACTDVSGGSRSE